MHALLFDTRDNIAQLQWFVSLITAICSYIYYYCKVIAIYKFNLKTDLANRSCSELVVCL